MNCSQFRNRYSDFADGLLDEAAEVCFHVHIAECPGCRRFDAAFQRGLFALRRLRPPVPSGDFGARLFERIAHECRNPEPAIRNLSGVAGAVLVLAAVGVAGWKARAWLGPSAHEESRVSPRAQTHASPFVVRFAGDSSMDYRGRFPVVPVSRDSFHSPTRPAPSFEITVDWMAPQ